ncbi:hypothetical protein AX774_g3342 [Zancudomyces culisetae]|uniref:Uncharacterized protein n=1 Tax=Zancudomyces culisetae TaxID=1213189 RepID=A0A1R1PQ80_ZANCU|nr:hypothetical protein AX774_g3342 [Zancudomyces culisetae]|eukprot:OMH83146.1 hypothetical protein AX774_g3342 [Zancudomyces culisetae]
MIAHPTRGGVAPLYNPNTFSRRNVEIKQSQGPLNLPKPPSTCIRTLTVSNGCPTNNFVAPEAIPAANPATLSLARALLSFFSVRTEWFFSIDSSIIFLLYRFS